MFEGMSDVCHLDSRGARSVLKLVGAPMGCCIGKTQQRFDLTKLLVAYYEEVPSMGLSKMNFREFQSVDAHGGKLGLSDDGRTWTYQPAFGRLEVYRVGIDVRVPEQGETVIFYGPAMVIVKDNPSQQQVLDRLVAEFMAGELRP